MKLNIVLENEASLRIPSEAVDKITPSIRKLIENMFETMYANTGVGLAAPQVGVNKRVIVIDTQERRSHPMAIINPEIIASVGEALGQEGCLSCPGLYADVARATEVTVTGKNEYGHNIKLRADGILAVAFQHEIDHLNGTLFLDRLMDSEKIKIEEQRILLKK